MYIYHHGIGSYVNSFNKNCKIVGCEPENANSMYLSLLNNEMTSVDKLDTFVDGASVRTVGELTYMIGKDVIDNTYTVDKNELRSNMVDIYQNEGIIIEPMVLWYFLFRKFKNEIKRKTVVCILSGGNNDILRYNEIVERSITKD